MLFNSLPFLYFFAMVMVLYFTLPFRFRWVLLLGASYYFYMCWKVDYLLLLILSTLVNYYVGIWLGQTVVRSTRKKILIFALIYHIGILLLFKYFDFFNNSLKTIFSAFNLFYAIQAFNLLQPIGISFYTFKSISYCLDVYWGKQRPELHLGRLALYVAFFPQLLAGPIERATRLLPQFHLRVNFDYQRVMDGLKLMLWGFFQKVVIADNLAVLVDAVYNNPGQYQGMSLTLATLFYCFQIYCDFSGYSDIAIGTAQIMGYQTMDNFNRPYFSSSIAEFWRRWHISLSTWLRDYLYIPLGGNRVTQSRWYFNLMTVFLLCGLWHGANWTFVIWGGLHGFYLVFSNMTKNLREGIIRKIGLDLTPKFHRALKGLTTFLLVCFAWIFFRANNVSDSLYIISHLFSGWGKEIDAFRNMFFWKQGRFEFIIGSTSILFLIFVQILQRNERILHLISFQPIGVRWCFYYFILLTILLCGNFGSRQFIYFQF